MISVNNFKNLTEHLVSEIDGLNHSIVTVQEEHFHKKAKDLTTDQMPLLLAVIPSADGEGDHDNYSDRDNFLMFVLTRREGSDRNDANLIQDYHDTQQAILAIKHKLIEISGDCDAEFHQVMQHLIIDSFHFDPEYNFNGWDGWSCTFVNKRY